MMIILAKQKRKIQKQNQKSQLSRRYKLNRKERFKNKIRKFKSRYMMMILFKQKINIQKQNQKS